MKTFFDEVRKKFGPLSQSQVDGFVVLLNSTNGLPLMSQAYILATAWHETGKAMQPVYEKWGPTAAQKSYEGKKALGNTIAGDGFRYRGRGYVQITGRANYLKASNVVGVDLVASPDRTLEPLIAAKIIIDGMTRGWFTGKKLADYKSFVDMRRVVNGTDRASLIAEYAAKFTNAILADNAAPQKPTEAPSPAPAPLPQPMPETLPAPKIGLLTAILNLILKILGRKPK